MAATVIILAAGKGTRMKSQTVKVLHPVAGRPMLAYSLDLASQLNPVQTLVVVGYQAAEVREAFAGYRPPPRWVLQPEQKGTADAVRCALPFFQDNSETILVLYGDVPLLRGSVVQGLLASHREKGAQLTLLTADLEDPKGYGRIVRAETGEPLRVVEHADASEEQRGIREINTGITCIEVPFLLEALGKLTATNAQGEYYLTDLVAYAVSQGLKVEWEKTREPFRALGINTRKDLAEAESILREEICVQWMLEGVSILDPGSTYIEPSVTLGRDTQIEPGCHLRGETRVGPGCRIGAGSVVADSHIGRGVEILPYSVVEGSEIADHCRVGPLTHLRAGRVISGGGSLDDPSDRGRGKP